ncbi:MAG: rhodanese-like domain-containing protein [Eubacterium sp.]|nr:rhodanese-like domain-containing protein [Eubacterium sp.]
MLCLLGVLLLSAALTGCGAEEPELILVEKSEGKTDATATLAATTETAEAEGYTRITMEDAKWYMSKRDDFTIVDVRTPSVFREGHIPNAINVPNENIGNTELRQLPDKDRKLLVYCRSGRRSKEAAEKLAKLGYTKVMEFGGIIDWDGEVVTEE